MRTTDASGTTVYLPRDTDAALKKLGVIGALAAAREWERACIVAAICRPWTGGGRPTKAFREAGYLTIEGLMKQGVYGLRSHHAVVAYLRAWEIGGLPLPVLGGKSQLPDGDFPDPAELYLDRAVPAADEPAPLPAADGEPEPLPEPEPQPQPHAGPPRRHPLEAIAVRIGQLDPIEIAEDHDRYGEYLSWMKEITASLESIQAEMALHVKTRSA